MTDVVVTHGAWSSGWAWKRMRGRLADRGITLWTPSYTGVGERTHLAVPSIDLDCHVTDVVTMLEYEDLRDVVIVAHSYGGMVGTGVLDRAGDRISGIVYLDAFVPVGGQSLFDLLPDEAAAGMITAADTAGDGWRVPPTPLPPDTSASDVEWITPRRGPQPIETLRQPLALTNDTSATPRSYIYCLRAGPGDVFGPFAAMARDDTAWRYREIDASHSPHITAPDELTELIVELTG